MFVVITICKQISRSQHSTAGAAPTFLCWRLCCSRLGRMSSTLTSSSCLADLHLLTFSRNFLVASSSSPVRWGPPAGLKSSAILSLSPRARWSVCPVPSAGLCLLSELWQDSLHSVFADLLVVAILYSFLWSIRSPGQWLSAQLSRPGRVWCTHCHITLAAPASLLEIIVIIQQTADVSLEFSIHSCSMTLGQTAGPALLLSPHQYPLQAPTESPFINSEKLIFTTEYSWYISISSYHDISVSVSWNLLLLQGLTECGRWVELACCEIISTSLLGLAHHQQYWSVSLEKKLGNSEFLGNVQSQLNKDLDQVIAYRRNLWSIHWSINLQIFSVLFILNFNCWCISNIVDYKW